MGKRVVKAEVQQKVKADIVQMAKHSSAPVFVGEGKERRKLKPPGNHRSQLTSAAIPLYSSFDPKSREARQTPKWTDPDVVSDATKKRLETEHERSEFFHSAHMSPSAMSMPFDERSDGSFLRSSASGFHRFVSTANTEGSSSSLPCEMLGTEDIGGSPSREVSMITPSLHGVPSTSMESTISTSTVRHMTSYSPCHVVPAISLPNPQSVGPSSVPTTARSVPYVPSACTAEEMPSLPSTARKPSRSSIDQATSPAKLVGDAMAIRITSPSDCTERVYGGQEALRNTSRMTCDTNTDAIKNRPVFDRCLRVEDFACIHFRPSKPRNSRGNVRPTVRTKGAEQASTRTTPLQEPLAMSMGSARSSPRSALRQPSVGVLSPLSTTSRPDSHNGSRRPSLGVPLTSKEPSPPETARPSMQSTLRSATPTKSTDAAATSRPPTREMPTKMNNTLIPSPPKSAAWGFKMLESPSVDTLDEYWRMDARFMEYGEECDRTQHFASPRREYGDTRLDYRTVLREVWASGNSGRHGTPVHLT